MKNYIKISNFENESINRMAFYAQAQSTENRFRLRALIQGGVAYGRGPEEVIEDCPDLWDNMTDIDRQGLIQEIERM